MGITSILILTILLADLDIWNGVNILFFREKPCILKKGIISPFTGGHYPLGVTDPASSILSLSRTPALLAGALRLALTGVFPLDRIPARSSWLI